MKFNKIFLAFYLFLMSFLIGCKSEKLIDYVNPFIGTAETGHTYPGATLPFAFVQVSPQTGNYGWKYCSGYNYADSLIIGFAQNHLSGTGCNDLGDVLLYPFTGDVDRNKYASIFDKNSEKASPGYYSVKLQDVDVELTATQRTTIHKYKFKKDNAHILVDLQSGLSWDEHTLAHRVIEYSSEIIDDKIIVGGNQAHVWVKRRFFYVVEFNKSFKVNKILDKKRRRES